MKIKNLLIGSSIALSAAVAGTASADVAAWDFADEVAAGDPIASLGSTANTGSAAGFLTPSGSVIAAAQPAGADTSDALGIQAGINGGDQIGGSSPIAFLDGVGLPAPGAAAPLARGLNGPGTSNLGITAAAGSTGSVGLVTGALPAGTGVRLSFGGQAAVAASTVSFSGSGCGSASLNDVTLTTEESETVVWLGVSSGAACSIDINLDSTSDQAIIDNIALSTVPEPGMVGGLGAGLVALLGLARRRSA